ncbi:MAG: hypothetical protein ACLT4C_08490 [Butyricicoccus sp.]
MKKFRVDIRLTRLGRHPGDATLGGAVYGLFDGDKLVDTYHRAGRLL